MRFSRNQFFASYREHFGSLTQQQVNGLERLLGGIEHDPHIPDPPTGIYYASYMLSTVKRETADTFTPIHEYGGHNYFVQRYGGQTRKGRELGNDTPEEGADYAGRGDAQTTGETNYEKAEIALRREYPEVVTGFEQRTGRIFDLTVGDQPNDKHDPDNMLDPAISYAVLSYGMRTGMWTGRRLSQYITANGPDYFHMREIVNGHDHAQEIADNARRFEKILRDALISVAPVRLTDTDVDNLVGGMGASQSSAASVSPFDSPAIVPTDPQSETPPTPDDSAGTAPVTNAQQPVNQEANTIVNTGDMPTTNQQDVNQTVTIDAQSYQGVGFMGSLKKDLAAIGGGNIGLQTLNEWAQQASGLPQWVINIISKLAIIAIILGAIWFLGRGIHYLVWKWTEHKRQELEATINSDVTKKNVSVQ